MHPPSSPAERRARPDRRRHILWSVCYGSFHPRRRTPPRRRLDSRFYPLDWHAAHLLAVAIGILLLSVADAFMTLILLSDGADEMNPLMAALLYRGVAMFTTMKLGMTSGAVVLLVILSRYRFMRVVRVDAVMYGVLIAYAGLIGYELWMLKGLGVPLDL